MQMGRASHHANHGVKLPALYEKMLRTAVSDPAKLREVGALIRTVGEDGVIPEEFAQMYEVFREAVGLDD